MKLTKEQIAVARSEANLLSVNAFAGSGKTSTLIALSRSRPNEQFLYLAYNKSMQADAQRRFPKNVTCMTTHSLAYRAVGFKYKKKLGSLRPYELSRLFKVSHVLARQAIETVTAFTNSAERCFSGRLLPIGISQMEATQILEVSHRLWTAMCDIENLSVSQTHDGYLKLYQLSNPQLTSFDCILLDEGQDSNPVTLDIFISQPCRKVIVGDQYQAIYGFRNATNALRSVKADERLSLTQSFRFGDDIATLATGLLHCFFGEKEYIRGLPERTTVFQVSTAKTHAMLCRTNAGVFDAAAASLDRLPLHFVGGLDNYSFNQVLDAYYLSINRKDMVQHSAIKAFNSFSEMETYAHTVADKELHSLLKIISTHGAKIPSLIARIQAQSVDHVQGPTTIITTAHRSKGLEFDQVVLWDDYAELADTDKGHLISPDGRAEVEEVHLLYVAMTRARYAIQLNKSLKEWLALMGRAPMLASSPNMNEHEADIALHV